MDFNFLGLCNRVLAMAGKTTVTSLSTSPADDDYQIQWCINDTLQDLSNLLRIKSRLVDFTITTVATQRIYGLPKNVRLPIIDLRQTETGVKLDYLETNVYDELIPNDTSSGDPLSYYYEVGSALRHQPGTADSDISVQSTHSADDFTTVIQAYSESLDGFPEDYSSYQVSVSGTTISSLGVPDFVGPGKIVRISKPTTHGDIAYFTTTYGTSDPLLVLGKNETSSDIMSIGLYPIPSKAITIYGRSYQKAHTLTDEYDTPAGLGYECINAIVSGAYARYMKYDPKYIQEGMESLWGLYNREVAKLVADDARMPDRTPRMRSPLEQGPGFYFRPLDRRTP